MTPREMDGLVAEVVFGYRRVLRVRINERVYEDGPFWWGLGDGDPMSPTAGSRVRYDPPHYGGWDSIGRVVDELERRRPGLVFYLCTEATDDGRFHASFWDHPDGATWDARSDSAAEAVCMAALRALGWKEGS